MDGRRLEGGSPLGPSSAAAELGSRQRPPRSGQARTTVPRLLEVTRRWKVPVARYSYEITQATAPNVPPERCYDVHRVDRVDHPESTFLRHGLYVRCPNQPTIRKSLVWPWGNVTEDNADGAAGMNVDTHQKRSNQPVVILARSSGEAK